MSRFLICTSDRRSWKIDRSIIFLGLWCLSLKKRQKKSKIDYIFSEPYGIKKHEKYNNQILVNKYKRIVLSQLVKKLNKRHGINFNSRLWNIIIGHWLERVIKVTYNRFQTLEKCFSENEITGFTLTKDHFTNFIPTNSNDCLYLFNNEEFNNYLFSLMLEKNNNRDFQVSYSAVNKSIKNGPSPIRRNFSIKPFILNLFNLLNVKSSFFYISTYLPLHILFRLSLSVNQIPSYFYKSEPKVVKPYDLIFREGKLFEVIEAQVKDKNLDEFLIFLNENIIKLLPSSYVELFTDYQKHPKALNWPRSPRTIFTSNNFDTDDVFKIWVSHMVERGAKYFVGQHGNNYGTSKYLASKTVEEETSDGFISWGWNNNSKNIIKGFYFKNNNYFKNKFKKITTRNRILIVTLPMLYQYNTWDDCFIYEEYLKKLSILLKKVSDLPTNKNFMVRLHQARLNTFFDESSYLQDKFDKLLFDNGSVNINKLYKKHSLVIHTYDSTGIFETLTKNIPTLILITDGFESHNIVGKNIYQILKDCGLLFFTSETLFNKIIEIEGKHMEWWNNKTVQDARKQFLNFYAIESQSPVQLLKNAMSLK